MPRRYTRKRDADIAVHIPPDGDGGLGHPKHAFRLIRGLHDEQDRQGKSLQDGGKECATTPVAHRPCRIGGPRHDTMTTSPQFNLPQAGTQADSGGFEAVHRVLDAETTISGVYGHIPFCFHKCHYCDFYSFVDTRDQQPAFVERLIEDVRYLGPRLGTPLKTIFIGGGTPTLLQPHLWTRLLEAINESWPLDADLEFTVEANPETVTPELAETLISGGVNRMSIGAQSFDPALLKQLERWHDPANVVRSVRILRDAGIDNLNLDLIFGIPTETTEQWKRDLDAALALEPEHFSCYGLMYEPNTALTKKLRQGSIARIEEDDEAAMYEATRARLTEAGYEQYEISNFARPGRACRHNLLYWRNENWWALGPSASGHVDGLRWKNVPRLGDYLARGPLSPVVDVEQLDPTASIGEWLMLRLRMTAGIPRQELDARLAANDARRDTIERFVNDGLLAWRDDALRFTNEGVLLADTVLSELM